MNEYCRYLKSDIYKLRHSWFLAVHLLFPVLGAALMLLYSHFSSSDELNKLAAFAQIIAIAFPFVISIVCQVVAEQELQAGHFQNMLTLPGRKKAIFSKLIILLLSGLFSVALSTVLFGVPFSYIMLSSISQERINRELAREYAGQIANCEKRLAQAESFKVKLYKNLVSGLLTKEEFLSYKRKYNGDIEALQKAVEEWNEKLTDVLENRSERNRWINHFMQFSTMEDIDRRAVMQLIRSIRVLDKDKLHIEFSYQDEYQKALSLIMQMEERKAG